MMTTCKHGTDLKQPCAKCEAEIRRYRQLTAKMELTNLDAKIEARKNDVAWKGLGR